LTGGLGNQLFQLAAALAISKNAPIKIYEKLGNPRVNSEGEAEIFSFDLDQVAKIVRSDRYSLLVSKSSGYLLRSGIWPRKLEKIPGYRILVRTAATLTSFILINSRHIPITISGVGYKVIETDSFLGKFLNPYLIGYFQSYRWPITVRETLKNIKLSKTGQDFERLHSQSRKSPPIIVHIRRGDYRYQDSFGLPGIKYYQEALKRIDLQFAHHPIWVFSDEEVEARRLLHWLPAERVTYVSDVDGSSAASLMAMRLGCAYVIANSTFSWWGAFLSMADYPLVVAPDPWFIGQVEPDFLIPSDWIRIKQ
jgi:hypothetical protein